MKRGLILIISFILTISTFAHKPDTNAFSYKCDVTDYIGIFYGKGSTRLKWTESEWEPYVVHTFQNGEKAWFFPGFSFTEIALNGRSFLHSEKTPAAVQSDWRELIDRLFAEGMLFDALDKVITRYKTILGNPPFRHKITVAIPMPVSGQKKWGSINGKTMNFNHQADRIKALKWYIDTFLAEYKKHHYSNFDFDGFYWMEEDMQNTSGLALEISQYIHKLGYKHYWKPYLKAKGSSYWDEYGFDYCYLQPGAYCIREKFDVSRVHTALSKAKRRGMGVLYEFDSRIFTNPDVFIPRLDECIDVFEQYGVYDNASMTYYDGARMIYDIREGRYKKYILSASKIKSLRNIMDRIATKVIGRYKKRYQSSVLPPYNSSPSIDNNINNNSNSSEDWRNPEYWHF